MARSPKCSADGTMTKHDAQQPTLNTTLLTNGVVVKGLKNSVSIGKSQTTKLQIKEFDSQASKLVRNEVAEYRLGRKTTKDVNR